MPNRFCAGRWRSTNIQLIHKDCYRWLAARLFCLRRRSTFFCRNFIASAVQCSRDIQNAYPGSVFYHNLATGYSGNFIIYEIRQQFAAAINERPFIALFYAADTIVIVRSIIIIIACNVALRIGIVQRNFPCGILHLDYAVGKRGVALHPRFISVFDILLHILIISRRIHYHERRTVAGQRCDRSIRSYDCVARCCAVPRILAFKDRRNISIASVVNIRCFG